MYGRIVFFVVVVVVVTREKEVRVVGVRGRGVYQSRVKREAG
jgi:hypothetical protein